MYPHVRISPVYRGSLRAPVTPKPRNKETKCFTLERGPRSGQFKLTVTQGMRTRRYEINSRRYDHLVRLANSGDYYVEIYDADWGIAWSLRRKLENLHGCEAK